MIQKRFVAVLLGVLLLTLTALVPIHTANASITVLGQIADISCSGGTLNLTSAFNRFTIKITATTIITINNAVSSCENLKAGMNAYVIGKEDGENIITADKIAASAQYSTQPFTQGGTIESTDCPNSIIIATTLVKLTIDVSGARFTKNNSEISCQDLKPNEIVYVRGEKRNGKYYAKYVDLISKNTMLSGSIQQIDCPETLVIKTSSGDVTVNIKNAVFYLNGKLTTCSEINVGDIASILAEKKDGSYVASTVNIRKVEQLFSYSGTIDAMSCPDTITIKNISSNVLITLTVNTVFKKNGLQTSCNELKVGDSVTVTGKKNGDKNVADQVISFSPINNFTITGEILSLACPDSIVVKTSSGDMPYNITGATLTLNGSPASCIDFVIGDKVLISGTIEGDTTTVKIVAVTREVNPMTLIGLVVAVDCTKKEVTVAVGNINYIVVLPPVFTRNQALATCDQIKSGDTCQAVGIIIGEKMFAVTATFASSGSQMTLTGVVKSIDCTNGIMVISTDVDKTVRIVQSTLIKRGDVVKDCANIVVGDAVTVHGLMVENGFVASEIILEPTEFKDVWEGIISKVDCANGKIIIKWGVPESLLEVNLANAVIKLNGSVAACTQLKVGMKVKITGKIVPNMPIINATLVEATTTTGPGCDGPFTFTGTLMIVDCVNRIVILRVGSSDYPISISTSTKITINGVTSLCTDLKVGMVVTITGECDPVKGKLATEISSGSSTDPTLKVAYGVLAGGLCETNSVIVLVDGRYIRYELDKTCVITIDGLVSSCVMLRAGMNIVIYYKEINGVLVAIKIIATTQTNPPPPPDDGGTNPPPQPPPGGGSGGGGGGTTPPSPPVGEKEGDGFESVIMVTKIDCTAGIIEGTDEYKASNKVVVKITEVEFYYKDALITCEKIKAGYLLKVKGVRGIGQEVKASQVEILPVSPVPTKFFGQIIDIDKVKGWVKLEKVQEIQIMSTLSLLENTILVHIDPTTTFDYRSRKLTIADLRIGVFMELTGSLDPINTVMTTNLITISARQAIAVNEIGRVVDVFCDKNMFWLVKDDNPESKYLLVKLSVNTTLTIDGKQVTCAEITKNAYVTVAGKLDPFDLFILAEKVDAKLDEKKTATIEGELMALNTMKQYLWIKVSDENGVSIIQIKYSNDTKFLAFGKTGSVSDIAYASILTVSGSFDSINAFIFNAVSVESMGKAEENLTITGAVVFSDCNGKVLFIRTTNGVERFELTSATKIFTGDTIAACADIKEGTNVTLTFDRKGTKIFTTKIVLPPPKTIIKLTVGLGVINVNGKNVLIDAPPYIKNGTTMVPIRVVTTYFGASLEWDQSQRKLTLRRGKDIIIAWIGRMEALVNGKFIPLMQAPEYGASDRMMVPIRFFSEIFGAQVDWDQETKTVTITM